jgi:hypothetical protein
MRVYLEKGSLPLSGADQMIIDYLRREIVRQQA